MRTNTVLHEAVSFTEVECHLAEILRPRITDHTVEAIAKYGLSDVFKALSEGKFFFEVTIEIDDITKYKNKYLIIADDEKQASERARAYMSDWIVSWEIQCIKQTKFLGVWHPSSDDWKSDFRNRMETLEAEGFCSNKSFDATKEDDNQLDLFEQPAETQV